MGKNYKITNVLGQGYEIIETKSWHPAKMREFCEENGYYTSGSNEEYTKLQNFVHDIEPNIDSIFKTAIDIYEHSEHDEYGIYEDEIEALMFKINLEVVVTSYEIKLEY